MRALIALVALLMQLAAALAVAYVWFEGVITAFHHSIIVGIVSIVIPPVGFIEGILHLLGVW